MSITNVLRENNVITLLYCNHSKCASDFLTAVKEIINLGYKDIIVKSSATSVFPNACVPISGIINHYKSQGIDFLFEIDSSNYLVKCGLISPFVKSRDELHAEHLPFDKIFLYESSGQVADITQAFIDSISHQSVCEAGVLSGLTWCINEVMDNVLVHSHQTFGLVMAQYHPTTKHIAFCIYDCGKGIYYTLKDTDHHPTTELDAISLSLQEGVGDGKGQGNGLFGLYQIVHENHGRLSVTSGSSSIMLQEDGAIKKFEFIPCISRENKGTIVDFQLDLNQPIDIKKAFHSIGGFDGFDIRIDNMYNDDDLLVYDIFANGQGTATRAAGEYLRNDIENILKRTETSIILDFGSVKTVSSSFIDELIAKMVLDLGFVLFNSRIRITNMTEEVRYLCERSLYMRIHDAWSAR